MQPEAELDALAEYFCVGEPEELWDGVAISDRDLGVEVPLLEGVELPVPDTLLLCDTVILTEFKTVNVARTDRVYIAENVIGVGDGAAVGDRTDVAVAPLLDAVDVIEILGEPEKDAVVAEAAGERVIEPVRERAGDKVRIIRLPVGLPVDDLAEVPVRLPVAVTELDALSL